jgi:tRNA(Ile)-lysidine synthase TilS/MesJ
MWIMVFVVKRAMAIAHSWKPIARSIALPIEVVRVDVKARAEATGESTQMAARALRRAWFHQLMERWAAEARLRASCR